MDYKILLFCVVLFTGCATYDKAMTPVDKSVDGTKTIIKKTGHKFSETMSNIGDGASNLKAGFMESSIMKMFLSDESVLKNRQENFVTWNSASKYKANVILLKKLEGSEINNPDMLESGRKMHILKEYFFDQMKKEHADKFSEKHKKPEFSDFLTDRENIKIIHEYKSALLDSEHQWRENLKVTQKQVAQLMLSTLYKSPVLKYVSYNPYKKELFLSVEAANGGFKEKIKINAKKDLAEKMKDGISQVAPYVFFDFNDDVLEFVGINIVYQDKPYVCKVVDRSYVRQSDVVFTSGDISLEELNVKIHEIVKNVEPPKWFNNLKPEGNGIIGYGAGPSNGDAKKEAYRDIAMSIKVTVSSNVESEKIVSGSNIASRSKISTQQKVDEISIEGSKVREVENKDGLWFAAIEYEQ